jgi:hypothetical protein
MNSILQDLFGSSPAFENDEVVGKTVQSSVWYKSIMNFADILVSSWSSLSTLGSKCVWNLSSPIVAEIKLWPWYQLAVVHRQEPKYSQEPQVTARYIAIMPRRWVVGGRRWAVSAFYLYGLEIRTQIRTLNPFYTEKLENQSLAFNCFLKRDLSRTRSSRVSTLQDIYSATIFRTTLLGFSKTIIKEDLGDGMEVTPHQVLFYVVLSFRW